MDRQTKLSEMDDDKVTLRDIMALQLKIANELHEIKMSFEKWKLKVILVSGVVALVVSVGVKVLFTVESFKAIF